MTPASIRKTMTLTVEKAKSLFRYDESTGLLSWRYRKGKKVPRNLAAGYIDSEGYRVVRADGVNYRAHRIVWLMSFGRWPTHMLDHVNGDRADNRLSNLREATNSQNQMNKKRRASRATSWKSCSRCSRRRHDPPAEKTPLVGRAVRSCRCRLSGGVTADLMLP